jgi:hypothetical protein
MDRLVAKDGNFDNGDVEEDDEDQAMADEDNDQDDDVAELEALLPSFEFRSSTARILIEVGELDKAISLLERLVSENDEIADVWLLLAECHLAKAAQDSNNDTASQLAKECLQRGEELCNRLLVFDPSLAEDEQFMTMVHKVKALAQRTATM